jgi:hypothetical protein
VGYYQFFLKPFQKIVYIQKYRINSFDFSLSSSYLKMKYDVWFSVEELLTGHYHFLGSFSVSAWVGMSWK